MIYPNIIRSKELGNTQLALLIDPDKVTRNNLLQIVENADVAGVDYLFIGGSLLASDNFSGCIEILKDNTGIPLVIFPGSPLQISDGADALLLLSLISGRNPELLIGQHVMAASRLKVADLEIIPTGYMLIDGGKTTSAQYISNTTPIPADKPEIAVSTAQAGELLGLQLIYMDAGSGATHPVDTKIISAVRANVEVPLIVGGGIRSPRDVSRASKAGADVVVVGTAIEEDPMLISELANALKLPTGEAFSHI